MSTPTEAYYDLRRHVIFSDPDDGAELIADSEANAVAAAVTALTCIHHNDLERAACPVCLVTALTAERDQLRAALALGQQNCDDAYDDLRAERDAAIARAERAEAEAERYRLVTLRQDAELTTERARLDAVIYDCWIIHKGNENAYAVRSLGEYITPWVATPRAAIDAAMKEGEK